VLDGELLGLPNTSNSVVVCKTLADTVLNLGVDNTLVRCQSVAAATPSLAIDRMPTPEQKRHRTMPGPSIR